MHTTWSRGRPYHVLLQREHLRLLVWWQARDLLRRQLHHLLQQRCNAQGTALLVSEAQPDAASPAAAALRARPTTLPIHHTAG